MYRRFPIRWSCGVAVTRKGAAPQVDRGGLSVRCHGAGGGENWRKGGER